MAATKSETLLFEFAAIFPMKFVPLEDGLTSKRKSIEIDLSTINGHGVQKSIDKFGKLEKILIPNDNFNEHSYEIQMSKNYVVDFFVYVPTYIPEMGKCFIHVILLDKVSSAPKTVLNHEEQEKIPLSLRYMYEIPMNESLTYVTGYDASCFILMSEFLAENKNNSYQYSKKSLDAFFK